MSTGQKIELLDKYKNFACAWNAIFKKRIPTMWFWIIYILAQISFFGDCSRAF